MGMFSRLPNSNDPPRAKSNWGSQSEIYDDFAALLNGDAVRCVNCKCAVITKHQRPAKQGILCPDCFESQKALDDAKTWFSTLTDEQRKDFIDQLTEDYCKHCYRPDPSCKCWNDE